jgi:hypothetical protein
MAMWACAGLLAVGGLLAAALVRTPAAADQAPAPPAGTAVQHHHCSVDAPPMAQTSHRVEVAEQPD